MIQDGAMPVEIFGPIARLGSMSVDRDCGGQLSINATKVSLKIFAPKRHVRPAPEVNG